MRNYFPHVFQLVYFSPSLGIDLKKILLLQSLKISMGFEKILVHTAHATNPSNQTALFRFCKEKNAESRKTLKLYLTFKTRI